MIEKNAPDLLNISEELSATDPASKFSVKLLLADLALLKKEWTTSNNFAKQNAATKDVQKLASFASRAESSLKELSDQMDACVKSFKKAVAYLGEDAEKAEPEEFFGALSQFLRRIAVRRSQISISFFFLLLHC
jgi:hypothetical protein